MWTTICLLMLIPALYGFDTSFTSSSILQHQITQGIKFMCNNQFVSNGQFLYEAYLKENSIDFDPTSNNMPRQAGGLYAIGMYYRLNQDHTDNEFSIAQCMHNSIQYLKYMSVQVQFNKSIELNNGELIDGCTGATALAVMGMVEICTVDQDICNQYLDTFKSWIQGLISIRYYKLAVDNNTLASGAFGSKLSKPESSSDYYDSEAYLALLGF